MGIILEFHGIPVESCGNPEEFLLESYGIPVESYVIPVEFLLESCWNIMEFLLNLM